MKRFIKASISWDDLSGADQMAVSQAHNMIEYEGETDVYYAAYSACEYIGEANSFSEYEDEDFYMEEPDYDKVAKYLVQEYGGPYVEK